MGASAWDVRNILGNSWSASGRYVPPSQANKASLSNSNTSQFMGNFGVNSTNRPGFENMNNFGQLPDSPKLGSSSSSNLATIKWGDMGAYGKLAAVGQGVSALGTLAELYLGFKAMGQAKKEFKFQKEAWNKDFLAQQGAFNSQVRSNYDKYAAGNSFFGNDYQSLDEYMKERSLNIA